MKLLIIISRISRVTEDITSFGVNQWIRSMMFFEHRQQNILFLEGSITKKRNISTLLSIKEKNTGGFGGGTCFRHSFQCYSCRFC